MASSTLPEFVRCNLCGADDAAPLFRPKHACGPVVQCKRCGLVYVNPRENAHHMLAHDSSRVKETWESDWFIRYLEESEWKKHNFSRTLAVIQRLRSDGERSLKLLDFGCSIGLFLSLVEDLGWQAYGIEPDAALALFAVEKFGLHVFNGTLKQAAFPDAFFDIVTSFQVFEHLSDPATELAEITRVLKPGGLLVIDVPSIDNIWYRILRGRHRHFSTPQHLYFFTPRTMTELLNQAGYRIVEIRFPTRSLSVEHVIEHHIAGYSRTASTILETQARRLNLLDRSLSLSLEDIMCVYAEKTADPTLQP